MNLFKRTTNTMNTIKSQTNGLSIYDLRSTFYERLMVTPILFIIGLLLLLAPSTHAAPPEFMSYQGYLIDANGNPLAPSTPANYEVIFRVFTAATGGTRLWSEQQVVTVDKGNFSVILGEGTLVTGETPRPTLSSVLSGVNNADRYMSLSVKTGPSTTVEMLPRLRMLPAPYAYNATAAHNLLNGSGGVAATFANNRVEVAGGLFASGTISGNGSGLTGLTASQIPALNASILTAGTLADARLSANVALRAGGNTLSGNQVINGNVAINASGIPLNFGASLGDKISLYGTAGNHYGLGIQGSTLQIHTDNENSRIVFGYGHSASMTEGMVITGTNVGIGTSNPFYKLDVTGDARITGAAIMGGIVPASGTLPISGSMQVGSVQSGGNVQASAVRARGGAPGPNGVNNNGFSFAGNGGDNDSGMFSSADGQLELYSNGLERMRIAGGRVGINTGSPRAPLDVAGSANFTLNATQTQDNTIDILDAFGHNNLGSSVNRNFSILAEQFVGAVGYLASSDQRIKTGITTSPKEKDLAAIQQLRVAEYRMTDTVSHGAERRKGFIAQEVEQIIPQAVSRSISFIPDIFALATNSSYSASTRTLALSLGKPHELKIGDRVRLHLDSDRRDLAVARVLSPYEFVVEGCEQSPRKVFVYGRQVDDFRTVDYDVIFTTGIGAIQELAAKVQSLESENKRLAQVEKEMNDLKQMVQQLAATRTTPRNAEGASATVEVETGAAR